MFTKWFSAISKLAGISSGLYLSAIITNNYILKKIQSLICCNIKFLRFNFEFIIKFTKKKKKIY